jgi:hypothetical protein
MTWRDILEIGLKDDASHRKDNLPMSEVCGPETSTGPGRSPVIEPTQQGCGTPAERSTSVRVTPDRRLSSKDRRLSSTDRRRLTVDRRQSVAPTLSGPEQAAVETAATGEGMPERASGRAVSPTT